MGERTTCLVVGGGPAGMVLGLLMARAGVEVTVLEKHADFLRDFRGDTVHPSTLQLLDELGLAEEFARLPHTKVEQVVFPTGDGGSVTLGDFRRLHVPYPYIAMTPQWDLLDLLADAGRREPTFTLRMSTEMTDLIREGDRVCGVRYRTADGATGEIRADLTVACDGRGSLARRQAGLRPKEFAVPIDAWWFRVPRLPGDRPSALAPHAAPGRFAVVIPRETFLQVAYIGRKGADPELRARGIEAFRADVAELIPEFRDRVDALRSMDDVKHLDVRVDRLVRWHVEGCSASATPRTRCRRSGAWASTSPSRTPSPRRPCSPSRCGTAGWTHRPWPGSVPAGSCRPWPCRPCSGSCTAPWWHRWSRDGGRVRPSRSSPWSTGSPSCPSSRRT
jgi:2-polyprenyl-6-methoxyphenol hydroxylase-like FAD-dependent oxidoreductase